MSLGRPATRRYNTMASILVAVLVLMLTIQGFSLQPSVASRRSLYQRLGSHLQVSSALQLNETNISPSATTITQVGQAGTPRAQPAHIATVSNMSVPSRDSNSVEISSIAGLTVFMRGSQDEDELRVVKYYAHYCKICQRAGIQMKKVALEHPHVRFGKVESAVFPHSASTLRGLGVTKFPFVQIYRRGQCVASFSSGPSHLFIKKVRDTLAVCLNRTPEEWDAFTTEFSNEIESNRQARENLQFLGTSSLPNDCQTP